MRIFLILCLLIAASGCATKGYVDKQFNKTDQRLNQWELIAGKNFKLIQDAVNNLYAMQKKPDVKKEVNDAAGE